MEIKALTKTYSCPSYLSIFKDGLYSTREEFCDAKLVAGCKTFNTHKIILAANSKYFHSMFVNNFKERKSEEIRLPSEVDAEAMQVILDYFYSGELKLSQENVESVLKATDYMRLDHLLAMCIEYMQETQNSSNCIRRYILAEQIQYFSSSVDAFKEAASDLIVKKVISNATPDFLNLSVELISKILKLNNKPKMAESLYALLLIWVGHDEKNRRKFLCDLLQMLPLGGFSSDFYDTKIKNEELLRRDLKSVLWLLDNSTLRNPVQAVFLNQPSTLFLGSRSIIHKCFLVNLKNPKPLKICDRPELSDFAGVCHEKRIFIVCSAKTQKSYRLDDPQSSWVECDWDLKIRRFSAGCVVIGDELYIFGGCDSIFSSYLNTVIKYNIGLGQKVVLPPMREVRNLPGAVIYANSVYAACGYHASPTIERFDPREGQWCEVGRYETKIDGCSSAIVADYLYSSDESSGKVGRFDFRANRSQEIASLPSGSTTEFNWISSIEGDLFGAFDKSIFKYDAVANKWNNFYCGISLNAPIIVPWI